MKKNKRTMDEMQAPRIPEYFAGKSVFLTGATGFIGKVLVEKFLRSCPDVKTVYALIRPKRGKSGQQRWNEVTEIPLFDKLKKVMPTALEKVVVIDGDIESNGLGISTQHKKDLIENVNFLFHGAAAVQFTDDLVYSLRQNTQGTVNVAEFAKSLKNLKCFVYVSTAYSNCDKDPSEVKEQIYPTSFDWKPLLEMAKTEPSNLMIMKHKLLCGHPATYTFTKNLAEQVMNEYSQYYPVVITRPSLVIATMSDPFECWVDVLNGLSALSTSIAHGIVRVVKDSSKCTMDYVSVDHAVKCFIISAWKTATKNAQNGVEVVSCNYGDQLRISGGCITNVSWEFLDKFPMRRLLWYPFLIMAPRGMVFSILFYLLQIIPAVIVDGLLKITGKEPMLIRMTIKMVSVFYGSTSFFMDKSYAFANDKFKNLPKYLDQRDVEDFGYDTSKLDRRQIVKANCLGTYKYIHKYSTDEKYVAASKTHLRRLKYLHYTVFACINAGIVYATFKIIKYLHFMIM